MHIALIPYVRINNYISVAHDSVYFLSFSLNPASLNLASGARVLL